MPTPTPHAQAQLEPPDQPAVIALIAELDAYQDTLYPPEARYALDLTALTAARTWPSPWPAMPPARRRAVPRWWSMATWVNSSACTCSRRPEARGWRSS